MRGLKRIASFVIITLLMAGLIAPFSSSEVKAVVLSGISLTNTATPETVNEGDPVTNTIIVTNNSGFDVEAIIVDEFLGLADSGVLILSGQSKSYTYITNPTQDIENTASVFAVPLNTGDLKVDPVFLTAIASVTVIPLGTEGYSIGYIYASSVDQAEEFQSLLEKDGHTVTLLELENLNSHDLSSYDLIIVGNDTGWGYEWGDATSTEVIEAYVGPLIGIGYGGSSLFEQIGLSLNWGNAWVGSETSIKVADAENPIFKSPYQIELPEDNIVQLYDVTSSVGEYAPLLSPKTILLGGEVGNNDHYPLALEGEAALWGFSSSPANMTADAKRIFLNLVDYMNYRHENAAPDLIVTDLWEKDGVLCYQIKNVGTASTDANHETALIVGGAAVAGDNVGSVLLPDARYDGTFAYDWSPLDPETTFTVSADYTDIIAESDETNNSRQETWHGDMTPPEIISGPSVTAITAYSATVSCQTDELSTVLVTYGTQSNLFTDSQEDTSSSVNHIIVLTGLTPATTYRYAVQASDSWGNSAESRILTFETIPSTDTENPLTSILTIEEWQGIMPFSVNATDDTGIEKVEFYMDGALVFTDFSEPYTFYIDTSQFDNGSHDLSSRSFDIAGNSTESQTVPIKIINAIDTEAPSVSITNPTKDEHLSGEILVTASITDNTGIREAVLSVDGWSMGSDKWTTPYPTDETAQFKLDTTALDNGKHRIAVTAWDDEWKATTAYVDIVVENVAPAPPPKLVITKREVTRTDNYFTIKLTVMNTGGSNATDIVITDNLLGFQPIHASKVEAEYTSEFNISSQCADSVIKSTGDIPAGLDMTYTYFVVPVLHQSDGIVPMIGNYTELEWSDGTPTKFSEWVQIPAITMADGKFIYQAHEDATKTADYLIVTSPLNLFRLNPAEDVNELLSSMAELARLKLGVLGFLDVPMAIPHNYEYDYQIAAGITHSSFTTYYTPTIAIGDADTGKIWMCMNTPVGLKVKEADAGFNSEGFEKGDALIFGEAGGNSLILMGDGSAHCILLYYCYYDETTGYFNGKKSYEWTANFDSGDGLGAGDIDGDGLGEIVVADKSNDKLHIYDWQGTLITSFPISFDDGDQIVVGDVIGDNKDEIVISDESTGKINIYSESSLKVSFGAYFGLWDYELALADLGWDSKDEIIVGVRPGGDGYIEIYDNSGKTLEEIPYDYYHGDGLAGCDFLGEGKEQLMIGSMEGDYIYVYPNSAMTSDPFALRDLIHKGGVMDSSWSEYEWGEWSGKLKDNWCNHGYMLIVGETDIVPAFSPNFGTITTSSGQERSLAIEASDFIYASTYGNTIEPELSVGRIVGNSAELLRIPIETSIKVANQLSDYSFDRSSSVGIAGYSKTLRGGASDINFLKPVYDVQNIISRQGTFSTIINTPDYSEYDSDGIIDENGTTSIIRSQFYANIQEKDIIHLAAHGTPQSWDVIQLSDILNKGKLFGSKVPFIYADSCSTANYVNGISMAEAFLQAYAGAYFGATHIGMCPWEFELTKQVFNEWDDGEAIGYAIKEAKNSFSISTWDTVLNRQMKIYINSVFNLFGDPKFGLTGTAVQPFSITLDSANEPVSSVNIEIPGLVIDSINGTDYVEIPGGFTLFEPYKPQVPGYQVSYTFPAGYQVQDVNLLSRSEPEIINGLNIPNTLITIPGEEPITLDSNNEVTEQWPENAFTWAYYQGIEENTLVISVAPLQYNPLTLQGEFYRNFSFAINFTQSDIRITGLAIDKPVYSVGEGVYTTVEFSDGQSGEIPSPGRDIFASYLIIDATTGEVIGGSQLDTLHGFRGKAAFSSNWDSTGTIPGYYQIEFELQDANGNLIDRAVKLFQLVRPYPNNEPEGTDNTVMTDEDSEYSFSTGDFGFIDPNDSPADYLLAVKITTLPIDGVLENNYMPITAGDFVSVSDIYAGHLVFSPDTNEYGNPYTSFTFQVMDDGGTAYGGIDMDQSPNTITINVNSINDEPVIGARTPADQTVEYSDPISTITITSNDVDGDDLTIGGYPAELTVSKSGSAGSYSWTISGNITTSPATYILTISDGDATVIAGVTITVIQEKALISFDVENPVALQVEYPGEAGLILDPEENLFTICIKQEADSHLGSQNFSSGDVIMHLNPIDGGPSISMVPVTASFDNSAFPTGGCAEFVFKGPSTEIPIGVYTVEATLNNTYYQAPMGEDVFVVYDPSLGFTTGGGTFYWPEDGSPMARAKTNFGFNMKYNRKATNVQGSLLVIAHLEDGSFYRIKSNALYGLALGDNGDGVGWASFSGKCTYAWPSDGELKNVGGQVFKCYVTDGNNPSDGDDTFWFDVLSQPFTLDADSDNTISGGDECVIIYNGNIVVPHTANRNKNR